MGKEVILLSLWVSPFVGRVKIALEEKGIEYETQEEDLKNKSDLLLNMNPIHKSVPVLIHNGKPISESINIIRYIDEVWNDNAPLLPTDPYEKAQAIFWANFVEDKVYKSSRLWRLKGEEQEVAKKEYLDAFKVLEAEIGEKTYFFGERFGLVDIVLVPLSCWFYVFETSAKFSMEEECPKVFRWLKRCMERESVSKTLPNHQMVFEYMLQLKKTLNIE